MSPSDHTNLSKDDTVLDGIESKFDHVDFNRSGEMISISKFPQSLISRLLKRIFNTFLALYYRAHFGSFGSSTRISLPNWIKGKQSIYIGDHVHIWRFARITAINPKRGRRVVTIGDGCVIHPSVHISAVSSIRIGKRVLIAANCYITDHDHKWQDIDTPPIENNFLIAKETSVGDNAWLGEKVIVLKGVSVGANSIIGSGSVVTKDVPAFSLAVGNPARVIKRFDHKERSWIETSDRSGMPYSNTDSEKDQRDAVG
jgi:lipopolysaccharide O-acetyltransferase